MKKFEVEIYYSTFCTYEIEINNEEETIEKARKQQLQKDNYPT